MSTIYKTINYGNYGEIKIVFKFDGICDTEVVIENVYLCTISSDNIEQFTDDFKTLIDKYFI